MSEVTLPASRVDFLDPHTGKVSADWYRYFQQSFVRIGGPTYSISVVGSGLNYSAGTFTINSTPTNTPSTIVYRDAAGNFSAGTITAALAGNASTASKWAAARALSFTGDATGSGSVDGSADVATALTLSSTGVAAGTYGSATRATVFTVNAKGRLTAASDALITPAWSSITGTPTTLAGYGITDAALDSSVVHLAGAETITGTKTFNQNVSSLPAPLTGTVIHLCAADGVGTRAFLDAFGANANFNMRRANNTAAAPSALAVDNVIGGFNVIGYGATAYSTGRASITFSAAQAWTDTVQGTYASINTTLIGATTNREVVRFHDTGDLSLKVVGAGYRVTEGTNAKQGTAVLVAGTKTVANTSVTANSRIFLTSQVDGGTPGFLRVSARVAGTSFTITSSNAADTSTVAYEIFEPS